MGAQAAALHGKNLRADDVLLCTCRTLLLLGHTLSATLLETKYGHVGQLCAMLIKLALLSVSIMWVHHVTHIGNLTAA